MVPRMSAAWVGFRVLFEEDQKPNSDCPRGLVMQRQHIALPFSYIAEGKMHTGTPNKVA